MNRLSLLLVSGCTWAVMMFLLFEREIRPYFDYHRPPSYRQMLGGRTEPEVQVRSIWFAARQIGRAETLTRPLGKSGYRIETRLEMRMKDLMRMSLKGMDDRVQMTSTVNVDAGYQLASMEIDASMLGFTISLDGERQGSKLKVEHETPFGKGAPKVVDLPSDAMIADNFLPYQGGTRLSVGKKWKIRVIDVNSFIQTGGTEIKAFRDVYATVEGREPVLREGRDPVDAFKVDVRKEASDELPEYTLWVDDAGNVIQQETIINKLPYRILLEERRDLTAEEAKGYPWKTGRPRGR